MKEWIRDIIIAIVVALIVIQFIKPTIVRERSMEPTLYNNNYIFLSKQAYRFSEPKPGDIVVFHSDLKTEVGKEKMLIKRIVGLPGDTIEIKDGIVYINDKALDEKYTMEPYTSGYVDKMKIPDGFIFAMGDNRQNSRDSRDPAIGCVAVDEIVGKAVFRLFPFDKIGVLH